MKTRTRLALPLLLGSTLLAPAGAQANCPSVSNLSVAPGGVTIGGWSGGTFTRCVHNGSPVMWSAFDVILDNPTAVNYYTGYSGPGNAVVTPARISVTGAHISPGETVVMQITSAGHYVQSYSTFWSWGTSPNYCTAGVSASGCQPTLSSSGTPSATAASGFTVTASGVEGDKDGIFFFGANGRQANSWGNGTSFQCVVPPVKRGGVMSGSGTQGSCDGAFQQDLNALWAAVPNKNPGGGAVVQLQLWYRDPASTSNQTTSLSDATEFTVCP